MDNRLVVVVVLLGISAMVVAVVTFSAGQRTVIEDCRHLEGIRYGGKVYDCTMRERTGQSSKQSHKLKEM